MSTKTRIDEILVKHRVDPTAQFGGYLEGKSSTAAKDYFKNNLYLSTPLLVYSSGKYGVDFA
jgi:hypothetical protein